MTSPGKFPDPRRTWLTPFLRIMTRTEQEMRKLLEKTARAAAADIAALKGDNIGAVVRRAQLRSAQTELLRTLAWFWRDAGDLVAAARVEASVAALQASVDWDKRLYQAGGISNRQIQILRDGMATTSERNVALMIRRFTTEQISLSRQVYRTQALTKGWIEGLVNEAIGKGLSAREFAAQVKRFIRPDTPGGLSFAAMRLSRTELNNAFHAASIAANVDKPWVTAMKWTLSRSHPKPDECDALAGNDSFDLGAGCFPPGQVPSKPHPQCFCYIVPLQVDEDEFVKAFQKGDYDRFLSKLIG